MKRKDPVLATRDGGRERKGKGKIATEKRRGNTVRGGIGIGIEKKTKKCENEKEK